MYASADAVFLCSVRKITLEEKLSRNKELNGERNGLLTEEPEIS
jgi:hypothetical protein